jgi:transcriptional regulator with XRE-family HTH domain
MVDKRWFQDRVRDADISQSKLAQMLGIDRSAMSLTFNGKRKMQLEEAARIAEILGLDVKEVLARAGVQPHKGPRSVSVVGVVDAAGRIHDKRGAGRADPPNDVPKTTVALRCEDRAAVIYNWVLFFVPAAAIVGDALERVSIVRTADGAQYLAALSRGFEAGTYNLRGLDGRMLENQRVTSASPVLWIRAG